MARFVTANFLASFLLVQPGTAKSSCTASTRGTGTLLPGALQQHTAVTSNITSTFFFSVEVYPVESWLGSCRHLLHEVSTIPLILTPCLHDCC
jgi:hypothetical protein